jgi:hypothetical protein
MKKFKGRHITSNRNKTMKHYGGSPEREQEIYKKAVEMTNKDQKKIANTLDERLVERVKSITTTVLTDYGEALEVVFPNDVVGLLSQIREDERARAEKDAWCAECAGCPEGHPTFWKTVVESTQWKAWEEEQEKRLAARDDKN